MSARINGLEIPKKFIRHVLPFVGGVRIVGDVSGEGDCNLIRNSISGLSGTAILLDAISSNGEKLDGNYTVSEIRIDEKKALLNRTELTFHIVLRPQ